MKTKLLLYLSVFVLVPLLWGCKDKVYDAKNFKITFGDDLSYIDPNFDDSSWNEYVPFKRIEETPPKPFFYWIRFEVDANLLSLNDPAISLGLIGDLDEVYFNGHKIGTSGNLFKPSYSHYHVPRIYRIPSTILKSKNQVAIRSKKEAVLQAAIHAGIIKIDEFETLKSRADFDFFLIYYSGLLFAFLSIILGFYHLYLYFRLPKKNQYCHYFIFSIFSSAFIFSTSWGFTSFIKNPTYIAKLNAFLGIGSAITYLIFTFSFLQKSFKIQDKVFVGVQLIFLLACFAFSNVDFVFAIYTAWYLFGLGTIVYAGILLFRSYLYNNRYDIKFLLISISIMLLCATFDVLHSLELFSSFQLVGLGFFSLNIGILYSLAQDFTSTYRNVERIVEDRTRDLSQAIEQLRDLEKTKNRFFANISHDFKTPITVAAARLDELSQYIAEKGQPLRDSIARSLEKLSSMVNDILETVRAESGEIKLHYESAFIKLTLTEWLGSYTSLARKKNIYFEPQLNLKDNIQIKWDARKFERVIDNLLSNAFKFCPPKGTIFVRAHTDAARLTVEVEDTGPGISPDEFEKVFTRYYQGKHNNLKAHGGSGIGLSYVKEVIACMKGHIRIENGDIGPIKFVVTLPLFPANELRMENNQNHTMADNVSSVSEVSERSKNTQIESINVPYPPEKSENWEEGRAVILVAEDNLEIAQILYTAISNNYNMRFAENGERALAILNSHPVDCILSDLMMPVMDGTHLLKEVRARREWQMIPFVFLTSRSDESDVIRHLQLGAQDYVFKPFNQKILLARLGAHVEISRLRKKALQSEKMASLGLLSAGLAHEIKNPLLVSLNTAAFIERIAKEVDALEKKGEKAAAIALLDRKLSRLVYSGNTLPKQLNRINEIISGIQGYAGASSRRSALKLHDLFNEARGVLVHKLKEKNITIQISGGADIEGYGNLRQVFINLLDNAIDASPSGGKVDVSIEGLAGSPWVEIKVQDAGPGISHEDLSYIFEPFYTTKRDGKGTGLGLFITCDIVESFHGGSIEVVSQPGKTIFTLRLPKKAPNYGTIKSRLFHGVKLDAAE